MKKFYIITLSVIATFTISLDVSAQEEEATRVVLAGDDQVLSYPLDVFGIIDGKCLGCHSPDARNDKSKDALQWIELQNMEKSDLIAAMDEVLEVLEEGEMPPAKIVEKYPHMKLTDEETSTLKAWAEATLDGLM